MGGACSLEGSLLGDGPVDIRPGPTVIGPAAAAPTTVRVEYPSQGGRLAGGDVRSTLVLGEGGRVIHRCESILVEAIRRGTDGQVWSLSVGTALSTPTPPSEAACIVLLPVCPGTLSQVGQPQPFSQTCPPFKIPPECVETTDCRFRTLTGISLAPVDVTCTFLDGRLTTLAAVQAGLRAGSISGSSQVCTTLLRRTGRIDELVDRTCIALCGPFRNIPTPFLSTDSIQGQITWSLLSKACRSVCEEFPLESACGTARIERVSGGAVGHDGKRFIAAGGVPGDTLHTVQVRVTPSSPAMTYALRLTGPSGRVAHPLLRLSDGRTVAVGGELRGLIGPLDVDLRSGDVPGTVVVSVVSSAGTTLASLSMLMRSGLPEFTAPLKATFCNDTPNSGAVRLLIDGVPVGGHVLRIEAVSIEPLGATVPNLPVNVTSLRTLSPGAAFSFTPRGARRIFLRVSDLTVFEPGTFAHPRSAQRVVSLQLPELSVAPAVIAAGGIDNAVHRSTVTVTACPGQVVRVTLRGGRGVRVDAVLTIGAATVRPGQTSPKLFVGPGGTLAGTLLSADRAQTVTIELDSGASREVRFKAPTVRVEPVGSLQRLCGVFRCIFRRNVAVTLLVDGRAVPGHRVRLDAVVCGTVPGLGITPAVATTDASGQALFNVAPSGLSFFNLEAKDLTAFDEAGQSPRGFLRVADEIRLEPARPIDFLIDGERLVVHAVPLDFEVSCGGGPLVIRTPLPGQPILEPFWQAIGPTDIVRFLSTSATSAEIEGVKEGEVTIVMSGRNVIGGLISGTLRVKVKRLQASLHPPALQLRVGDSGSVTAVGAPVGIEGPGSLSVEVIGSIPAGAVRLVPGAQTTTVDRTQLIVVVVGVRAGRATLQATYTFRRRQARSDPVEVAVIQDRVEIIDVLRITPNGQTRSILGPAGFTGSILTTDRGFVVRFLNPFRRAFAGALLALPPDNLGMLAGPPAPAVSITARVAGASIPQPGPPAPRPAIFFEVPAAESVGRPRDVNIVFPFKPSSVNFPSGAFHILLFAGPPLASVRIVGVSPAVKSNVAFELIPTPRPVPQAACTADVVVDSANRYSENACVRVRAVPHEAPAGEGLGPKDTLTSFTGRVLIEEDFVVEARNAYTPTADAVPIPKGEKGFFALDGKRIGTDGLSLEGSTEPGIGFFVAKSFREATSAERKLFALDPRTAKVLARLQGEHLPRGSIEIPQWVDRITRTRDGRFPGGDGVTDWLQEHAWDILKNVRPDSADPVEQERADLFDTVLAVGKGKISDFDPNTIAFVALGERTININPFIPPLRANRADKTADQLAGPGSEGFPSPHFFSGVMHHEARHVWQSFLLSLGRSELRLGGMGDGFPVDHDRGTPDALANDLLELQAVADPDNDDDPKPLITHTLPTDKPDDGDHLPEKALKRVFRDGTFVFTGEEYVDATSDRSPIGDPDDGKWRPYGDRVGLLDPATGEGLPDGDPASNLEKDASDYGRANQREE